MTLLDWLEWPLKKENITDVPVTPISLWAAMMASNSSI
jgi:hypothetical protein